MNDDIKLIELEINNCKKIDIVHIKPNGENVIIGGGNTEGKSSVLDILEWALIGKKKQPSGLKNTNTQGEPVAKLKLSNGMTLERNSKRLKLVDSTGQKHGQAMLDEVLSSFALSLPEFMNSKPKDKCKIMLDALGDDISMKIDQLEQVIETNMEVRKETKRDLNRVKGTLETLPDYCDAPDEPLSITELVDEQKKIYEENAKINQLIQNASSMANKLAFDSQSIKQKEKELQDLKAKYEIDYAEWLKADELSKSTQMLDVTKIEKQIEDFEIINERVRSNQNRNNVEMEHDSYKLKVDEYTGIIEDARNEKIKILESVNMPLPGMTVENGELILKGQKWDCMSTAEQYITAASIVSKLKPNHKFILLDKLEVMDNEHMQEFLDWCASVDLQVIATRVSTGSECNVIIKAGRVLKDTITKVKNSFSF